MKFLEKQVHVLLNAPKKFSCFCSKENVLDAYNANHVSLAISTWLLKSVKYLASARIAENVVNITW